MKFFSLCAFWMFVSLQFAYGQGNVESIDATVITFFESDQYTHKVEGASYDTVFEAGSISKYVCTIAVLSAVNEGLITLDMPISESIPNWHVKDNKEISVAHVLANRSGLGSKIATVLKKSPNYPVTVLETSTAMRDLISSELLFRPNEKFDYEIVNWLVIQNLLETIYKRSIEDILYTKVFVPAKMTSSGVFRGNLVSTNLSVASAKSRPIPSFLACGGGVKATSMDLIKLTRYFYRAFPTALILQATNITTEKQNYALGGRYKNMQIGIQNYALNHQAGQNGQFRSSVVYVPALDAGFAIMTVDSDFNLDINNPILSDFIDSLAK